MNDKKMRIGVNANARAVFGKAPGFELTVNGGKGVDFVVCHHDTINQPVAKSCEEAERLAQLFREKNIDFISNHEDLNFNYEAKTPDGFDWANDNGDGTHRMKLPDEYVQALNKEGNCLGIMYDEFEHVIINRNISILLAGKFRKEWDKPAFLNSVGSDVVTQGELLSRQLNEYAAKIKSQGAKMLVGEHVYPVLFHTFARNGITPNFKSQKESFSNIQFAIAAGAAMQYNTPLYNCVDCWYRLTNPGHSAEEMYYNLVFAYLAGVNNVYVESISVFTEKGKDGIERLSSHGKQFGRFSAQFRGRERDYDVQDYTPEIGIIRYDDTFWGQGYENFVWKNMLFGNPAIKTDKKSKEYVKVFNLLTHGATGNRSLSWGSIEPHSLTAHRSFAPMNSPVVFDDRVTKDKLKSLKLCFLCGHHISSDTLKAVRELVRENGLTVVTTDRFAPLYISMKCTGGRNEVKDGKGSWIIVDDFASSGLKKRLKPFLGKKDEIVLRFGEKTVKMKLHKNGNGFDIMP